MRFSTVIRFFCLVFFCLNSQLIWAQDEAEDLIESVLESVVSTSETEEIDLSDLTDRLYYYRNHPLDLNRSSSAELESLTFLTDFQIIALQKHKARYGPLIDLAELQVIDLFDKKTILALKPFVQVRAQAPPLSETFKGLFKTGKSELVTRIGSGLENTKGFKEGKYLGNKVQVYNRYNYEHNSRLSINLIAEKDAGEQFFQGGQSTGFDFYSGNAVYKSPGRLRQLIIGDYSLQFGQGLALWTGYGMGKSALIMNISKNGQGIKPFRSAAEYGFFRGAAANVALGKKIILSPFVSYRKQDANILLNDTTEREEFRSIGTSGYHRTENELDNRNTVNELMMGGNVSAQLMKRLKLGLSAYQLNYETPVGGKVLPYNKFEFTGSTLQVLSMDYQLNLMQFYFSGEGVKSLQGGFGFVNNLLLSVGNKLSLALSHRYYSRDYYVFYSNALGESSRNSNEEGFYSGLSFKMTDKWEFTGYVDFFRFPWLRYRVNAPSKGTEALTMLTYTPSKTLKLELRFKQEDKEINRSDDQKSTIIPVIGTQKQNLRLSYNYQLSKQVWFGNRIDYAQFKEEDKAMQYGTAFAFSFGIASASKKIAFDTRYTLFDIDAYNARIYAPEKSIQYAYSLAMFQDKGSRFYLNLKLIPRKNMTLWCRYSIYDYQNKDEIGSGDNLIIGSQRSELTFQTRFVF